MNYKIYGKECDVYGIKGDRVVFRLLEPDYVTYPIEPDYVTYPSFKIFFDCNIGYYVNLPTSEKRWENSPKTKVLLNDILKNWSIYTQLKEYNELTKRGKK